jgi:HD-GYP domain-containing protein (c-di-GMP phosphodiesterase class II)
MSGGSCSAVIRPICGNVTSTNLSVRRAWGAFTGDAGWRAVAWPGLFALFALALLVFDHLQNRIGHLVFWLCVALIAAVFGWLVETARRQSGRLAQEHKRALQDAVTGLPNKAALYLDLRSVMAGSQEAQTMVVFELDGLQAMYDENGEAAGNRFVAGLALRFLQEAIAVGGNAYRIAMDRFVVIAPTEARISGEFLISRSGSPDSETAFALVGRAYGEVTVPAETQDADTAMQLAGQRVTAFKQGQQRSARRQAHAVLMAVLAARRPDLREHLRTVAFRALSVSRRLGLDRGTIDDIFLAAELHDIGLLTVPETVLEKETALDPAEIALIRNHPAAGARIVASASELISVAEMIAAVSERFDGSGHPDGLVADQIPIGSRILRVCVAYAAMTAERPYRPARTTEEAVGELRRGSGSDYDPVVVEALAADLAEETGTAERPLRAPETPVAAAQPAP